MTTKLRTPEENMALGIEPTRLMAFDKGALSYTEMAVLMQDIVEANVLDKLEMKWIMRAAYYTQIGLLHPGAGLGTVENQRLN